MKLLLSNLTIILFATLAGVASTGCAEKNIPLFNPDAAPLNRVASANELLTECNTMVADFVAKGWITQVSVNASIGLALDNAAKLNDEAEILIRAGSPTGQTKLESVATTLKAVRSQLLVIQRSHQ